MKLHEISYTLEAIGLHLEARPGGTFFNVRGRSSVDARRIVYRMVRVNIWVLQKLAAEIRQVEPEPRAKYQAEIQRALISKVMKRAGASRSTETVAMLENVA